MKKNTIIWSIIAIIVIVLIIVFALNGNKPSNETGNQPSNGIVTNVSNQDNANNREVEIDITSAGFSPSFIEITQGTKVIFVNKDTKEHWPASDVHPTHTVYPGSDIKKCGTSEEDKIFDSCYLLKQGESWSFVFNEKGTWAYHDHWNSRFTGRITIS